MPALRVIDNVVPTKAFMDKAIKQLAEILYEFDLPLAIDRGGRPCDTRLRRPPVTAR